MNKKHAPEQWNHSVRKLRKALVLLTSVAVVMIATVLYLFIFYQPDARKPEAAAPPGAAGTLPAAQAQTDTLTAVDAETGFVLDTGWELVKANCTGCHSAQLVTQNRATREGWEGMIRWMQRTQKLWDLGENEEAILDYLSKNYAPGKKGRRENLKEIEWYELEIVKQ